ncbi:TetR/AcrR family transcriptional regulator [Glacieibacterium frigidum]|uniref:TetR family transcriptional regulator n=1 Tax=Glacieibacterium frigidum TaxID=2593303 RepID=A0A552UG15_9SPHN|nr:TetR family transcriptional regulator [Glacieibacterium frigidum]TRW17170.1 TetR family transcriptional regulator [Glacieibacterium frigidum]
MSEIAQIDAPGRRDRQRDATRAAILTGALALFSRRGFEGTTLPAVAQRCGVAVPLIVYHFQSKDGLWRACVEAVYARIAGHLAGFAPALAEAEGPAWFRLQIRAFVTALAAHPEYMRIVFHEGMEASPRLEWLVAGHQGRITAHIVGIVDAAQAAGYLPAMDATHAKFVLSGAFALPIVLAAEYTLIDGTDALSDAFIERHVDTTIALILPGLNSTGH